MLAAAAARGALAAAVADAANRVVAAQAAPVADPAPAVAVARRARRERRGVRKGGEVGAAGVARRGGRGDERDAVKMASANLDIFFQSLRCCSCPDFSSDMAERHTRFRKFAVLKKIFRPVPRRPAFPRRRRGRRAPSPAAGVYGVNTISPAPGSVPRASNTPDVTPDRRYAQRHAIQLHKITAAELTVEGEPPASCYVFVVDLSEGGLCITTDTWIEPSKPFRLEMRLQPVLAVSAEVVWSRQLTGGTNVYGLKFLEVSEEVARQVKTLIDTYSVEARRLDKGLNLNRVMAASFDKAEGVDEYVLVQELSDEGMLLTMEAEWPEGSTHDVYLRLDSQREPVKLHGWVSSAKRAVFERRQVAFVFREISEQAADAIKECLDRALGGSSAANAVVPELDFGDA